MKMKKLITILFLLAAILLPSTAAAYDFQVNGIAYKTDLWDDYAMVADWGEEGVLYTGVVTIPESVTNDDTTYPVTKIGAYAFAESTGLTGVNIPASVTEIGDHAFENCSGLPEITIPETVTTIGARAFVGCTKLSSIEIPAGVTEFGIWAFLNCDNLKDVYCHISDPTAVDLGSFTFSLDSDEYSNRTLHVPAGSVNAYKESDWAEYFTSIVEM